MAASTRSATAVIIYCPARAETLRAIQAGDGDAIATDPVAGPILALIRATAIFGDFGKYRAVVEISAGTETFIPTADARPTLGEAGAASVSPTIVLTIFVDGSRSQADILDALGPVIAAHPWEVPVIELRPTSLVIR